MARQRGDAFLLQLDQTGSGSFATVAGLRGTALAGRTRAVDVTAKDSGGFRQLLDGAGLQSFTLSGTGVFDSGAAHDQVQALFLGRVVRDWRILRGDGSSYGGPCLVTALDFAGNHDGEETFSITLESAGAMAYGAP